MSYPDIATNNRDGTWGRLPTGLQPGSLIRLRKPLRNAIPGITQRASSTPHSDGFFSPIARRLALLIAVIALVSLGLMAIAIAGIRQQGRHNAFSARTDRPWQSNGERGQSELPEQANAWSVKDLSPALTLAGNAGVAVEVRDDAGSLVTSAMPPSVRSSSLGRADVFRSSAKALGSERSLFERVGRALRPPMGRFDVPWPPGSAGVPWYWQF